MHLNSSNTAIIVDSACDLPEEFKESSNLFILPIGFQINDKHFRDRRITEMAISFYNDRDLDPSQFTRTLPTSSDAIRNFIIENIVDKYENLIVLCISSTRSRIFENAIHAVNQLPEALSESPNSSKPTLNKIKIIDTLSVFSGEALLAYYAINLINKATREHPIDFEKLVDLIEKRRNSVSTFVIPRDLGYLRERGKMRNEKSVGAIDYAVAKFFGLNPVIKWQQGQSKKILVRRGFESALDGLCDRGAKAIDNGLSMDVIMVSYSGDIENIRQNKIYDKLYGHAKNNGIRIYLTQMSITASIYLGPNSISLSYSSFKSLTD